MHIKITTARGLLVAAVILGPQSFTAQAYLPTQSNSLDALVETLKAHQGCSRQVTPDQMKLIALDSKQLADWIGSKSADTISAALPRIVSTLSNGGEEDRICAAQVLLDVALRADSATLLGQHLNAIGAVLNSASDERLQRSTGIMLTMLHPKPPPEAVPPLLVFLGRTDRDLRMQAAAVGSLAGIAPTDSAVILAIQEFWSRPLDAESKQAVLNGLGNSHAKDQRLVGIVISSLHDPDPSIRLTAVQALRRMGPDAIRQAAPELRKISSSTPTTEEDTETHAVEIRRAAAQALEEIERR